MSFNNHRGLYFVVAGLILMTACMVVNPQRVQADPAETVAVVNADPSKSLLGATAQEMNDVVSVATPDKAISAPGVVVWQADRTLQDIRPAQALALGEFVRNGGSLLLTMSATPGAGPYRLGFALPSIPWQTLDPARGPATIGRTDASFEDTGAASGSLELPWYFPVPTFDARERGIERYDVFPRLTSTMSNIDIPAVGQGGIATAASGPLPADNDWWTRPLINRDWQERAWANDNYATPILITGLYGAGRVAVLGTSLEALGNSPQAADLLTATLKWLGAGQANGSNATANFNIPPAQATVDREHHAITVTLSNPGSSAVNVQAVSRLCTWEGALIGDTLQTVDIPPGGHVSLSVPVPQPSDTGYQALTYRDAYILRFGVLSNDRKSVLNEVRLPLDFTPPVSLSVATDELGSIPYPFDAPAPGKENRLGTPISTYAYKPGQTVNAAVTISNHCSNIAPLAVVSDTAEPNNASVTALISGGATVEKGPIDGVQAYGDWTTTLQQTHALSFTFPHSVWISSVTLQGEAANYRNHRIENPPDIIVQSDTGKELVKNDNATDLYASGNGRATLTLPAPVQTKGIVVSLPWVAALGRHSYSLGQVMIDGWSATESAQSVSGTVTVALQNAMTGEKTVVHTAPVTVPLYGQTVVQCPVTLPSTASPVNFLSLDASFQSTDTGNVAVIASQPLLVSTAQPGLKPMSDLVPQSAITIGFIVTRGFHNVFDLATGTSESVGGWGQPDDLVWAYERMLKQVGANSRQEANRLYLSDSDMRHYSTPWRNFANGIPFFDVGAQSLVNLMKKDRNWSTSSIVQLGFSDRWDCGPELGGLNTWQDFEAFNDYLVGQGKPALTGKTHQELAQEIHTEHESDWEYYQLQRYIHAVKTLVDAFQASGKQLVISAQGVPLVPIDYESILTKTIMGMSDDSTWGMAEDNVPLTTGRQMAHLAFDPDWQMSTLNQWGYESGTLQNMQWHSPVGTTEPSRRQMYDAAFRGALRSDASYTSMSAYGYNTNAGFAYTMNGNDYQQWEEEQEKRSLIAPQAPIGLGVVLSTSRFSNPATATFSGTGSLQPAMTDITAADRLVQRLQAAGLSVAFSTNSVCLSKWQGSAPLVLVNINHFSSSELDIIATLADRGVPIVAFQGDTPLTDQASRIFGGGQTVGTFHSHSVTKKGSILLVQDAADNVLTDDDAIQLAPFLLTHVHQRVLFPQGTQGYGFKSGGLEYVVLENWQQTSRVVPLKFQSAIGTTTLHAVNVNDNSQLQTTLDSSTGMWTINAPLRPADADLIAIEE